MLILSEFLPLLQRAPSTVGVPGLQALITGGVLLARLNLHLADLKTHISSSNTALQNVINRALYEH